MVRYSGFAAIPAPSCQRLGKQLVQGNLSLFCRRDRELGQMWRDFYDALRLAVRHVYYPGVIVICLRLMIGAHMSEEINEKQLMRRLDRIEAEREIIAARSAGESPRQTVERLKISREDYQKLARSAAKRAGKHLVDETSVYLLNLMMRLDRATKVVTDSVEAGDLRSANTLANLVNATASLAKVVMPTQAATPEQNIAVNAEIQSRLVQMGFVIPPPMLGNNG